MASKKAKTAVAVGSAAAIFAVTVPFLTKWEGTDLVAKRDMIGTGHPVTYCHGQTDEFGKVKVGTRFTPAQCDAKLGASLPTYLAPLQACVHVELPVKTIGALLDAAYNAGTAAVCKSPMVAHMNAGNISAGCAAFSGWYVRASGRVVKGLINRRADEKQFCMQGVAEGLPASPKPRTLPWWQRLAAWIVGWFK